MSDCIDCNEIAEFICPGCGTEVCKDHRYLDLECHHHN